MTDEESRMMEFYEVTSEQKTVYLYLGKKYDKLSDALNYAKIVTDRNNASAIRVKDR